MHTNKIDLPETLKHKKVAIVHDWLTVYGGAERVVEEFCKIFPDAPIYTTVYNRKNMESIFPPEKVKTSYMQRIPGSQKLYTKMLHLMPRAFESFDLSEYDLVLSSSSSCAKGVLTTAETKHVSYIHTPMRYAWDLYHEYMRSSGTITRMAMRNILPKIREWDALTGLRVDSFLANSSITAKRVEKVYRRKAKVIFPPVNTGFFGEADLSQNEMGDYYFLLSRFVPYKRIDLAIQACNKLGRKLIIAGDGGQRKELKAMAGPTIEFTGRLGDNETRKYYQNSRAFLFPGYEDFGITPVEAMSCGIPVIAYGKGGALDSVIHGKTGVYFPEQTVESLIEGIEEFESSSFNREEIKVHATTFSPERFRGEIIHHLSEVFTS
ncbi:MAG: glycosyltransferase [Spirochaetales bacterium]|nr:glycosyltransferase [Spirochaetales bacterium]